jgi:hypothetical protein
MTPIERVTTEMSSAARVMDVDDGDDPRSAAPARRCSPRAISLVTLLITGAIGGVAGVATLKYAAPDWLLPKSAGAFTLPEAKAMPDLTAQPPAVPTPPLRPVIPTAPPTPPPAPPRPTTTPTTAAPAAPLNPFVTTDELARRSQLRSILQTCRAQLALYQLQHADKKPEFTKYPAWAQLTGRTRADGTPDPRGEFGPYLAAPPVNPLNEFGALGLVRNDLKGGQTTRGQKLGFFYATSTGKLFATDRDGKTVWDELAPEAADAPARLNATLSPAGKTAALNNELQSLRAQIELYKLQHIDHPPDFGRFASWEQMRKRTRPDGTIDPHGNAEPLLDHLPVNAQNNFSKVEAVGRISPTYRAKGKEVGFLFEISTGRLLATDPSGAVWRE